MIPNRFATAGAVPIRLDSPVATPRLAGGYQELKRSDDVDSNNPLRTIAFFVCVALVFIKFALIQEILTEMMSFNTRLIVLFGIPCIVGVLLTGGFARVLRVRTGLYWTLFALWLMIGTPFSTWKGGSAASLEDFLKAAVMVFVIGGLVVTWKECTIVASAIGLAAILNVISGRIFGVDVGGERYALQFGSVSNANDFAAHLLLTLPFAMYLVMSRRFIGVRLAAAVAVCFGLFFTLKTASRGAEVALAVDALLFLALGNMKRRIAVLCLAPISVIAMAAFLPDDVVQRLRSFSHSDDQASAEALASSDARRYVFDKSIEYTLEYPIFGVGMDQFSEYEGSHSAVIGTHGYFHGTHNSFTEASSEGGIPAGLLLLAGWISSFLVVFKINRDAKKRPDCEDIERLTFYYLVAITGFVAAITFLNFAFSFYGPAMGGLAIALKRSGKAEMEKRAALPGVMPAPVQVFNANRRATV